MSDVAEPIAIVGMAVRLPGSSNDPAAFWRLLCEGRDAVTETPPRWDMSAIYDPDPDTPGTIYVRHGAFVDQVDGFDPQFFGISPREASQIDPQQRMALECAVEALEDAGQPAARVSASQTGVFMGVMTYDYSVLQMGDPEFNDPYGGSGGHPSIVANRISYQLNLHGPSVVVDTACSSGLVAIHFACQSLRQGECTLALAGGVNASLLPDPFLALSKAHMVSADGRCKTFDASADGYGRGEGCGVLVLRRLAEAIADGDRIYAVVRGSAINHDGRTIGLTAPNGLLQRAVIRKALAAADVAPESIDYVEAHGTGTPLGDPIEVEALADVYGRPRADGRPCIVGSVKTNIGHCEAASGAAGVIKATLALRNELVPPHLHLKRLNPHIKLDGTALVIPTTPRPWPRGAQPRRAAVSSFGFGGANGHVILEEAPALEPAVATGADGQALALPLSARSPEALRAVAQAFAEFLERSDAHLADIAYTASVRRTHHDHRVAVVGRSAAEFAGQLRAFATGAPTRDLHHGTLQSGRRPRIAFVYSGQGSQWAGMGTALHAQEPVFRAALEECDACIRTHAGWSVLEVLADADPARLEDTEFAQPAIFALQVALTALWRSFGVEPEAVVGHSIGEVTAAYVAGALDLEQAARVIVQRSRAMRGTAGRGKMVSVALGPDEVVPELADCADRVAIAAVNAPTSVVLSGSAEALDAIVARLEARGVVCRPVRVNYAFHSPQMADAAAAVARELQDIAPRPTSVPCWSTVTGRRHDGTAFDASHWGRNVREAVSFAAALADLAGTGVDVFLEVGSHPVLRQAIADVVPDATTALVLSSLRRERPERETLLGTLCQLYAGGHAPCWDALYPRRGRCLSLPAYPWQRQRYWADGGALGPRRVTCRLITRGDGTRAPAHPLLTRVLHSAVDTACHHWETDVGVRAHPWLADHRVGEMTVVPGAAWAEMALAAAAEVFPEGSHRVEQLRFLQPLVLGDDTPRATQVALREDGEGGRVEIHARLGEDGRWTRHATARVRRTPAPPAVADGEPLAAVQERCAEVVSGTDYYAALRGAGLHYGPTFRLVSDVWRRDGEAVARLRLPASLVTKAGRYTLHPAVLDATFQTLAACLPAEVTAARQTYVPVGLDQLVVDGAVTAELWVHAVLHPCGEAQAEVLTADIRLLDANEQPVARIDGVRVQRLEAGAPGWRHEVRWREAPRADQTAVLAPAATWIVLADDGGVGDGLVAQLTAAGMRCVRVEPGTTYEVLDADRYRLDPEDAAGFRRLLADACGPTEPPCRGVVHLWALHGPVPEVATTASLELAERLGCVSALHCVQALLAADLPDPPRFGIVTRGAQAVTGFAGTIAVHQAPILGLAKVVALEHPELACSRIDLDPDGAPAEDPRRLVAELLSPDGEDEVALRGDGRFVPRLVRADVSTTADAGKSLGPAADRPFRWERSSASTARRHWREVARTAPGPHEVEVETIAAALPTAGDDAVPWGCAGTVTAVGADVTGCAIGDQVVAPVAGPVARFSIVPAALVMGRPATLSPSLAAARLVPHLAAELALGEVGHAARGERVLVQDAGSPIGLAALAHLHAAGCRVFASAGGAAARERVAATGMAATVFDEADPGLAEQVQRHTAGGVDLVFHAGTGAGATQRLALLAPYGRLIDVITHGSAQPGPWPDGVSATRATIDLRRLATDRPGWVAAALGRLVPNLEAATAPVPLVMPLSQLAEMAGRPNGADDDPHQLVLTFEDAAALAIAQPDTVTFPAAASYLVSGGLGGIGLCLAEWLVSRGARHLVLLGRRGAPPEAEASLAALRGAGAEVIVVAADVADAEQVGRAIATAEQAAPLRGVFHAAGLLDDGLLFQLDVGRLRSVLAPKIRGAWNLHRLTRHTALDHFVLFSSVASMIGSPGQGSYTAANAFLDALAHHRRGLALPATSINWGPWSTVGMAAGRTFRGLPSLTPARGLAALEQVLRADHTQMGVFALDVGALVALDRRAASAPLLRELTGEQPDAAPSVSSGELREELLALPAGIERQAALEERLRTEIAYVLRLDPDEVDPRRPLTELGFDSLMFTELKSRLEGALGITLPATMVFNYPTVEAIVPPIAQRMGVSLSPAAEPDAVAPPAEAPKSDLLEAASDAEVEAWLLDELQELEREATA